MTARQKVRDEHDDLMALLRADGHAAEKRLAAEIERGPVGEILEPSNFEASAEAAFRERQFSRPCKVCKGTGARDLGKRRLASYQRRLERAGNGDERRTIRGKLTEESHCHACEGSGRREPPDRRNGLQRTLCEDCRGRGTVRGCKCEKCRGDGSVCLGKLAWWVTTRCPRCKGAGRDCALCEGAGYTVPITVQPRGSSRHGHGPDMGAAPADTRTSAGKVIDPVADRDTAIIDAFGGLSVRHSRLARALTIYRGPLGNRWGHGHPYGRAFALWPETESGRVLLAEAPEEKRVELGARPLELLVVIRDEEDRARVPTMRIRALFTRADREARLLVEEARVALGVEAQP